MIIRCAGEKDFDRVRGFYHLLIDMMRDGAWRIGWEKDIYPSQDFLIDSLRHGELYTAEEGGQVVSAMVCNQECNEGYRKHRWHNALPDSEVLFIHALGSGRTLPDGALEGPWSGKPWIWPEKRTAGPSAWTC